MPDLGFKNVFFLLSLWKGMHVSRPDHSYAGNCLIKLMKVREGIICGPDLTHCNLARSTQVCAAEMHPVRAKPEKHVGVVVS